MTDSKDAAVAIPEGMVAWHGGDSAPAAWDGGRVLCSDGEYFAPANPADVNWMHGAMGISFGVNVVAYTPVAKPTAPIEDGVTVTQADRDAAACRLERSIPPGMEDIHPSRETASMIRAGKMDPHQWVQEFARHASKARAEEREAAAKVQPVIAEKQFGPEPSWRGLVRAYYGQHFDPEKADTLTEQYFAAIREGGKS